MSYTRKSFSEELQKEMLVLRRFAQTLTGDTSRAEDLTQDCLVRALEKWTYYKPGSNMRSWLFTVMKNIYLDQLAKQKRCGTTISIDEDHVQPPHIQGRQYTYVVMQEFSDIFERLERGQKDVLTLVGIEGYSYEETAERLSIPVGTVKSRLYRGRRRLQDMELEKDPDWARISSQQTIAHDTCQQVIYKTG